MPTPPPDKVIVTHKARLVAKYKAAGWAAVLAAVKALVVADAARGLVTELVDLSSAADAKKYGFTAIPLAAVGDAKKHKQAIDKVYKKADEPAYLMLLGSVDVIPHVPLKNPVFNPAPNGDPDPTADGDIPYACSAAYSTDPRKFLTPNRVVGRLPDLTKGTDPAYLVGLLDTAAKYTPRPAASYAAFMGLTAAVWNASTTTSLTNVFGGIPVPQQSPPVDHPTTPAAGLGNLSHFINCHGSPATPQFFGQNTLGLFPVALDASQLAGAVQNGTVAAAECCYGAELYDPALATSHGLCSEYLAQGAYGFLGSSTIAYGPAVGNGQADLICQYFLDEVLKGASVGRAALTARLKFVTSCGGTVTGTDLKTLAQFNLLGDPAVTPVAAALPAAGGAEVKVIKSAMKGLAGLAAGAAARFLIDRATRDGRREWLRELGGAITAVVEVVADAVVESLVGGKKSAGDQAVAKALTDVADEMGMKSPAVLRFDIGETGAKGGGTRATGAKTAPAAPQARRVHLVTERVSPAGGGKQILIRGFEAIELDGTLTIRKFHSR